MSHAGDLITECESAKEEVPSLSVRLPADRDPVAVYVSHFQSPESRRTMAQVLRAVADLLRPGARPWQIDWTHVKYQHVAALKARLCDRGLKPRTVNKMLCAIRGVLRTCWELGYISHEQYARVARVKGLKTDTLLVGRRLSFDEISALLQHCLRAPMPSGLRDAALIAALVGAGLRRAEVVSLKLEDYDREEQSLTVQGKGSKERVAYLMPDDALVIEQWIEARGPEPGPLFCPVLKSGTVAVRAMTKQAVYAAVSKRAAQLGLEHFSPHSLRRTLISSMLDAGIDLLQVQDQVGHASPTTTKRYDMRPAAARRAAIRTRLTLLRGGRREQNDTFGAKDDRG